MDPATTGDAPRQPLSPMAKALLVGWLVVGVVLTFWFLAVNPNAGEWQDLVNFMAVAFMFTVFVAVTVSWVIARFAFRSESSRIVVALLGPPGLVALVPVLLRVM